MKKLATLILAIVSLSAFAQGPAGSCVFIDFEAFSDDGILRYINCGNSDDFNTGDELTIEAWTRINDTNWNQKIAGKTNPFFNSGYVFAIDQGDVYGEIWNPGLNEIHDGFIPPVLLWYHLAITFEAGGMMRGYVNGEMVQEISVSANGIVANSDPFIIGIAPWDLANFQTFGELDEMRVWNTALSGDELRSNMFRPITGSDDGLVAYYNFNEGSGTSLEDNSNNDNTGTFVGLTGGDWVASRAPIGEAEMQSHEDVVGLWNGVTFADPRFVITDNGLSMTASDIPDLDYCVFGHDGNNGTTTDDVAANAPAGFERAGRIWYLNEEGEIQADLTFNLTNVADGGSLLANGEPAENYTLMMRSDDSGDFSFVAQADDVNGAVVTFEDISIGNGYYTIGIGDEPAEIEIGIEELEQAISLNVFPNPTADLINWQFDTQMNETFVVQIFDMSGKMVRFWRENSQTTNHQADVSELQPGTYFLRVEASDQVAKVSFVKE